MAEVVNLRAARKAADRAAKRAEGDRNAALHGRSKGEKLREAATADKARRELDAHRLDRHGREDGPDGQ